MKKVKTVLSNYFELPNPGLNTFLDRTEKGQPDDYRTPFWNKAPREEVVSSWKHVVDSSKLDDRVPGLYAFEEEQRKKVGPYSIVRPFEQRAEDVEHYFKYQDSGAPIDRRAVKEVKKSLRRGSLSLMSIANVLKEMRLNTNSGACYFQKRKTVVDKTVNSILSGRYKDQLAAVCGVRGQQGGPEDEDVKNRVIWMFPFAVNIQELRFYKPLIKAWQTDGLFAALTSLRAVEKEVTLLFDTKGDELVVATDFSKFDQHINPGLQALALELELYQFNRKFHSHIQDIYPIKFNLPIVCTADVTYEGPHGMGSGSGGTNPDENMIHKTLQHEAAILNGATLNKHSQCLGDDGILSFHGITVDKVVSAYSSHNLEMNPDKQYADKHSTVYLQRYYHDSYRDNEGIMLGIYSTYRALGRLLGQERFYDPDKWSADMVEFRAWSILENAKNSPLFEQLVDFVIKGDKFRLGLDLPGFMDNLGKRAHAAQEAIPDLFGYVQGLEFEGRDVATGILQWRVYKYLKSIQEGGKPNA